MCLVGQNASERGNDARPVVHSEAQIVGALLRVTETGLYSPSRSCANGETRSGLPLRISRATRIRSLTTATPVGSGPAPRP